MKCRNCGADISMEAVKCAYCGTANPAGKKFLQYLTLKREENKALKKEVLEKSKETYINRVLNIAIAVLITLTIIVIFVPAVIEVSVGGPKMVASSEKKETMRQFYEKKEYARLYAYMSDYNLIGEDNYGYSRVALIYNHYMDFLAVRNECMEMLRNQEIPKKEQLSWVIDEGVRVLYPSIPAYPEEHELEIVLTDEIEMTVMDFFRGVLGFGDEELNYMNENLLMNTLPSEQCTYLSSKAEAYLRKGGVKQ